MANILLACGLRAVVQQLRAQAQSSASNPIQGSGKPPRVSQETLYGWLEDWCLEVGNAHERFPQASPLVSPHLFNAHTAVQRLITSLSYAGKGLDPVGRQPLTPSSRLAKLPSRPIRVSGLPHEIASPPSRDSERTPSSRSATLDSQLAAEDFETSSTRRSTLASEVDD